MKISNRDWVQLSAYLDGELSVREAKKLEDRLTAEPGLLAALEDLRSTKQILSRTPKLRVPRNFTLTSQQVGVKRARSASVGYSWAAAVLSLLFVAVVVVDFGTGYSKGALSVDMAPRSEQILPEAAMEAAPAVTEGDTALLAADEAIESGNAADQETEPVQEAAAPAAEEVTAGEEGLAMESDLQNGATQDLVLEQAKTAPQETGSVDELVVEEELETQDETGLGAAPSQESEVERYYEVPVEEIPQPVDRSTAAWYRIIEILLALGAIGFASAAWIRRRGR
jgi:anti-sigma factor RsiW